MVDLNQNPLQYMNTDLTGHAAARAKETSPATTQPGTGALTTLPTPKIPLPATTTTTSTTTTPTPTTTPATAATAAATAASNQSASAIMVQALQAAGLGGMTGWALSTFTTLTGQGMANTDVVTTIESQLNNPQDYDPNTGAMTGTDQAALTAFDQALPGFNQRIANGYDNGSPGDTSGGLGAIGQYISYNSSIQGMANAAGLQGQIGPQEIGALWASDASPTEVSDRITQGIVNVQNLSTNVPGFAEFMQNNYGISQSDLVGYYLGVNPNGYGAFSNSDQTLQTQINTGTAAAEAGVTGFGSISAAQGQQLSAFLASNNSSGLGGIGSLSAAAANNAFTTSLGPTNDTMESGGSMGSAAQMEQAFGTATPGNGATLSQDQLLGAIEGNLPDIQNAQQLTSARKAGGAGGGGFAQTSKGAEGLGFATE